MCCVNKRLLQIIKKKRLPRSAFLEKQLQTQWSQRLEVMSEMQGTLYIPMIRYFDKA